MEDNLQEIEIDNEKQTNFRKWSFRLFVDLIFVNGLIFYHVTTSSFPQLLVIQIFSILSLIFLIGGCVFLMLSIIKKEQKNYQYWVSVVGFPLYLILLIGLYLGNYLK